MNQTGFRSEKKGGQPRQPTGTDPLTQAAPHSFPPLGDHLPSPKTQIPKLGFIQRLLKKN
jgi:hypothetical protein